MLIEQGMLVYVNSDGTLRVHGNKEEEPFGMVLNKPVDGQVQVSVQGPCISKFIGIFSMDLFKGPVKTNLLIKRTRFQILKSGANV